RTAGRVEAHGDDGLLARVEQRPATVPALGALAQRSQHALEPRQQRLVVVALAVDVHRLVAEVAVVDDRTDEVLLPSRREAAVGVVGPLHRRADRLALLEVEVLAHADLLAVPEDGRA